MPLGETIAAVCCCRDSNLCAIVICSAAACRPHSFVSRKYCYCVLYRNFLETCNVVCVFGNGNNTRICRATILPLGETVAAVCCCRDSNLCAIVICSAAACRPHSFVSRKYCYCVLYRNFLETCNVVCVFRNGNCARICRATILPLGETIAVVCCGRNCNLFSIVICSAAACRTHRFVSRKYCYCVLYRNLLETSNVCCIFRNGNCARICRATILPLGETIAVVCCGRNCNLFSVVVCSAAACRTHCVVSRKYIYSIGCYCFWIWIAKANCRSHRFACDIERGCASAHFI